MDKPFERTEMMMDSLDDFFTHLVAFRADAWADACLNILRFTAKMVDHRPGHAHTCPLHSAAPASMGHADNTLDGIIKEDGRAICKAHDEGCIGLSGDDSISLRQPTTILDGTSGNDCIGAVDLPDSAGALATEAKSSIHALVVFADVGRVITNTAPHVQRCPGGRTDTTMTGKNAVTKGLPDRELVVGQIARRDAFHYTKPIMKQPQPVLTIQSSGIKFTGEGTQTHETSMLRRRVKSGCT